MNNGKAKISVIVPIYNAQDYLEKCVCSIINQTYLNLEIILVDDGSTDDSARICDYLANQDDRIIIFHKKNGGLSSARNAGLKIASGDWIGFVDSDDCIRPEMYEKLINMAVRDKSDIAMCGYFTDLGEITDEVCKEKIYETADVFKLLALTDNWAVWSKLYRRAIWDNVRFSEGKTYEDVMAFTDIAPKTKSWSVIII